jgi:DNA-binding MarR family transcriptional regulator
LRKVKMRVRESATDKSAVASALQAHVLAALSAVPLDQARLFRIVVHQGQPHGRGRRLGRWMSSDDSAAHFFDTLALLQADGLISRSAHPLEDRRLYYLTEKGGKLAKEVVAANERSS